MFFNTTHVPAMAVLEENWQAILDEYHQLNGARFIHWPEKDIYENRQGRPHEGSWDVFGLYAFGKKIPSNCAVCPRTTKAVESIPGMMQAGYSILAPGTHINPHKGYLGYSEAILRAHLGLIVPEGCRMRVEKETQSWEPGRVLIFDDMMEHEVWNDSGETRVVLLVDFTVPEKQKYKHSVFMPGLDVAQVLKKINGSL
jgi:beta-hydroxylase